MKLTKSLLVLAALGIGMPVYANGPVTVNPGIIQGVGVRVTVVNTVGIRVTQLILRQNVNMLPGGNIENLGACSATNRISVLPSDPIHARAFALFNTAMLTGKRLVLYVQCWTGYGAVAITTDMFEP